MVSMNSQNEYTANYVVKVAYVINCHAGSMHKMGMPVTVGVSPILPVGAKANPDRLHCMQRIK